MVRRVLVFIVVLCNLTLPVYLQVEPRLFDYFSRVPCGDMMARLDALLVEWTGRTDHRVVVIYYGHRYRKTTRFGKDDRPEATILNYAHRDDGLNWAKGIPKYLMARVAEGDSAAKNKDLLDKLRENVVLINGGYRDELYAQIWLVPPSSENPEPAVYLTESQITFAAKESYRVPNYIGCYDAYK